MWYPFRCVEVDGDRAAPLAVALDGDAFPVGSYAVDKSLRRILCRKDSRGWYRIDEPVTSWGVLTAELEIVYQERYKPTSRDKGRPPPYLPCGSIHRCLKPNSATSKIRTPRPLAASSRTRSKQSSWYASSYPGRSSATSSNIICTGAESPFPGMSSARSSVAWSKASWRAAHCK
ncbi:hypothetical protein OH76DRAFT_1406908 [Lentinus brumalis]|uniref:Uncharacterized protein n=1 Tax=Lentinus brumalis TaxID=2498619 RepID=A0A371D249_9APHY|nr:hypothetical protein OH76DRAFT_1406908 [Polyporus brumalis]